MNKGNYHVAPTLTTDYPDLLTKSHLGAIGTGQLPLPEEKMIRLAIASIKPAPVIIWGIKDADPGRRQANMGTVSEQTVQASFALELTWCFAHSTLCGTQNMTTGLGDYLTRGLRHRWEATEAGWTVDVSYLTGTRSISCANLLISMRYMAGIG